jgi:hypothetical protein
MKKLILVLFCSLHVAYSLGQVDFSAGSLKISLDEKGYIKEISDVSSGIDYIRTDTPDHFQNCRGDHRDGEG